jgi:hypothetical protein
MYLGGPGREEEGGEGGGGGNRFPRQDGGWNGTDSDHGLHNSGSIWELDDAQCYTGKAMALRICIVP